MKYEINEIATKMTWKNFPIDISYKIIIELIFSKEQFEKMKIGLIPQSQEDKWFIYFEDNWLFFHRSWTGYGIYKAKINESKENYLINEFFVERNQEKYRCQNDEEDIDNFTFLIAWGLLKIDVREIYFRKNKNSKIEAIKSWSNFGNLFISKNDIDKINNNKK